MKTKLYKGLFLDSQLVDILEGLEEVRGGTPPTEELTLQDTRQLLHERAAYYESMAAPANRAVSTTDLQVGDSNVRNPSRLYEPEPCIGDKRPLILYLHGGAWMRGDLDTHDHLASRLSVETGCRVLSIAYRLAPEHPFPAALEDACTAFNWVYRHASELAVDKNKIAAAGDSAGGNIAAALVSKLRDESQPLPAVQILLNPVLDLSSFETDSYRMYGGKGFGLTKSKMEWARGLYIPDRNMWNHPYVSPLLSADHSGLPPTFILTSEFDPLRDEGEEYAKRICQSGVYARHVHVPHVNHGLMDLVGVVDAADRVLQQIADFTRTYID